MYAYLCFHPWMSYEYVYLNVLLYIGKHIDLIWILNENCTKYETAFIKK
jgi:hypothetical protein